MRHIFLSLLLATSLGACKGEEAGQAPAQNIKVSSIGEMVWPGRDIEVLTPSEDSLMVNNMIVLDMSGSMNEGSCSGEYANRADAARSALLAWLDTRSDENIGLPHLKQYCQQQE